jgi:hypothetical protein
LVHDPAGNSGKVVFCFLSEEGFVGSGEDCVDETFQKSGKGALEGGGG